MDSITGNPIEGAKFQIWYGSNSTTTGELNDLGTHFTDERGEIVLEGLRDGWYKVTELEPAHGFTIKEPATQEIYIEGGESKSLTFENVPLNAIVVHKTDSVTGEALAGATFQLRYLGGASGNRRHRHRAAYHRRQRHGPLDGPGAGVIASWRKLTRRTGTASSRAPRPSTLRTMGSRASSLSTLKTSRTAIC